MDQAPAIAPDWRAGGFGVYVHWPFCLAKCPYCDFNSHVWRKVDHPVWAKSLTRELAHMRQLTGPRKVGTVFFGGGTPSLMPPETVARLIAEVDRLWGLDVNAEVTLEANPTSVEAAKFRGYADAGVNRVSMGVQALRDADLKALGRMHSVAEARAAFDVARSVFDRVSFDLIYARMNQTVAEWETELAEALTLAIDHLSLYQLTIEDGTRFGDLHARGRLVVPADGIAAEMYDVTQTLTGAAGLPAYEISNYARPGAESRHNLVYWRYGDYAGAGPGAHGRITLDDGQRLATTTERDPAEWLSGVASEGHAIAEIEPVERNAQASEYLMMSLRLVEGSDLERFAALNGDALPEERIAALVSSGHLVKDAGVIRATAAGRIVLNSVLANLLT